MKQLHWKDRWPDLRVFLEDTVLFAVDSVGASYYHAIEEAWGMYGPEGLSMQLLYISNNLRPRAKKGVDKELTKWSKKIDKEHAAERKAADAKPN